MKNNLYFPQNSGFSVLLLHSVFVEVYEEILASHIYLIGKGRSTLIAFPETYAYSLIHKNSTMLING